MPSASRHWHEKELAVPFRFSSPELLSLLVQATAVGAGMAVAALLAVRRMR